MLLIIVFSYDDLLQIGIVEPEHTGDDVETLFEREIFDHLSLDVEAAALREDVAHSNTPGHPDGFSRRRSRSLDVLGVASQHA